VEEELAEQLGLVEAAAAVPEQSVEMVQAITARTVTEGPVETAYKTLFLEQQLIMLVGVEVLERTQLMQLMRVD
jgi:hypothetical protein